MFKKITCLLVCLLCFTGCSKSKIITTNIDSFNINELTKKNITKQYETPILVLLENNQETIISVVTTSTDMNKAYYYKLDSQIGYGIYEHNQQIYLQNDQNNYLLKSDGSIVKEDKRVMANKIIPIENKNPRGYCFNPDCEVSNEKMISDYEFILLEGHFNYKDYEIVSFIRLCK